MKKLSLLLALAVISSSMVVTSAEAVAPKPGGPCPKLNQIQVSAGFTYTCIKSGKKLVWSKGVKVPAPAVSPTKPSPTPTPTPTPLTLIGPENPSMFDMLATASKSLFTVRCGGSSSSSIYGVGVAIKVSLDSEFSAQGYQSVIAVTNLDRKACDSLGGFTISQNLFRTDGKWIVDDGYGNGLIAIKKEVPTIQVASSLPEIGSTVFEIFSDGHLVQSDQGKYQGLTADPLSENALLKFNSFTFEGEDNSLYDNVILDQSGTILALHGGYGPSILCRKLLNCHPDAPFLNFLPNENYQIAKSTPTPTPNLSPTVKIPAPVIENVEVSDTDLRVTFTMSVPTGLSVNTYSLKVNWNQGHSFTVQIPSRSPAINDNGDGSFSYTFHDTLDDWVQTLQYTGSAPTISVAIAAFSGNLWSAYSNSWRVNLGSFDQFMN